MEKMVELILTRKAAAAMPRPMAIVEAIEICSVNGYRTILHKV